MAGGDLRVDLGVDLRVDRGILGSILGSILGRSRAILIAPAHLNRTSSFFLIFKRAILIAPALLNHPSAFPQIFTRAILIAPARLNRSSTFLSAVLKASCQHPESHLDCARSFKSLFGVSLGRLGSILPASRGPF